MSPSELYLIKQAFKLTLPTRSGFTAEFYRAADKDEEQPSQDPMVQPGLQQYKRTGKRPKRKLSIEA